jgi:hypothetical protein
MTFIHVMTPQGRFNAGERRILAKSLTDAVLMPEVGRPVPEVPGPFPRTAARHDRAWRRTAQRQAERRHGVVVMDCCWTREDREAVIRNVFAALTEALGMKAPSPGWWINFRIIEEGCWGSRGGVLSFHDLLDQGGAAFPPERAAAIRTALSVKYDR